MHRLSLVMLVLGAISNVVLAGGGGQNMLLIVNPNDENSLRIATAYQQLRNIPDSNVLFLTPPQRYGYDEISIDSNTNYRNTYVTQVTNFITSRGLTDQIDYIGTFGESLRSSGMAVNFGLANLTQVAATSSSTTLSNWSSANSPLYQASGYTLGTNNAIHHSITYTKNGVSGQWYVAGAISYTGNYSPITAAQTIAALQRSVAADGTKPAGTVYLETNGDSLRVGTRSWEYAATETALTARGIPWQEYNGNISATPLNASAVRGATVGAAVTPLPNGSTYIPGSWADTLTSGGMEYRYGTQDHATKFIAAGAACSSGAVVEPYANSNRFPNTMIYPIIADGSTLGEAFYKTTLSPVVVMPVGDILCQPYADMPSITLSAAPTEGQTVSGSVTITSSATVVASATTTGVARQELWIDGKLSQTKTGASGTFNIDSTAMSDGRHELRVVAYNNSAAESQSCTIRDVIVNNTGRWVAPASSTLSLTAKQVASLAVAATPGNGIVQKIEMRQMGRTISTVTGASGNSSIDATKLAYGDNTIIPVAIYSDGKEVAGNPITVTRNPDYVAGTTPLPASQRQPGVIGEWFINGAADTYGAMNFQGDPVRVDRFTNVSLHTSGNTFASIPSGYGTVFNTTDPIIPDIPSGTKVGLRLTGRFTVDSANTGEYDFFLINFGSGVKLTVDGVPMAQFNASTYRADFCQSAIFLSEGEHSFDLSISNATLWLSGNPRSAYFDEFYLRGPDGAFRNINDSFVYSPVPEPASLTLLCLGAMGLLRIRRKR